MLSLHRPIGLPPLGAACRSPFDTHERSCGDAGTDIYEGLVPPPPPLAAASSVGSAWAESFADSSGGLPAQPLAAAASKSAPMAVRPVSPLDANADNREVKLETFLGKWRDSMGNIVQVDWARPGSKGGQLDVQLSHPKRNTAPIRLNVKGLGGGCFACGHYDLDVGKSGPMRITWVDCRSAAKVSVWEREGVPPA